MLLLRRALYHPAVPPLSNLTDRLVSRLARQIADRYEFGPLIGRGGQGLIHLGRNRQTGANVALKIFPSAALDLPTRRTIRRWTGIDHPRIVRIHELVVLRNMGVACIVMDHIAGAHLRQHIASRRDNLSLRDVLCLFSQAAEGIDALHAAGIVHLDIKPENFIVEGTSLGVRLVDVGTARVDREPGTGPLGEVPGTAAYMAPERIVVGATQPPVDIYAFAATVFHLLAGEPLFPAATHERNLLAAHVSEIPVPLHLRNPLWPEAAGRALGRSLAKSPADRHPGARALIIELATALEGLEHLTLCEFSPSPEGGRG